MYPTVFTDVAALGAGANRDVQPPAGEDWRFRAFGSSAQVGVPPNAVPDLDVGLIQAALGPSFLMRAVDVTGWYRKQEILTNHDTFLRITNPGLAPADVGFTAEMIRKYGAGPTTVASGLQTLGAGASFAIQPPAGYDYVIKGISSDQWVGVPPKGIPNVQVDLTDGVIVATIMHPTELRYWEAPLDIPVNHDEYVLLTNMSAVDAVVGYSVEIYRHYGAAPTVVMNSVANCLALGTVDFQPAAGEEWRVTGVGAGTWVGVSPLMFPDITAGIYNGAENALVEIQTEWLNQGHPFEFVVDNTDYLRITDTSGVGQVVGISAEKIAIYA